MKRVEEIHAIHKQKLEEFLSALGLLEDFNAGKLACKFCGSLITRANLAFIFPYNGKVCFSCDKSGCIYKTKEGDRREA
jgi:hypothetical protein